MLIFSALIILNNLYFQRQIPNAVIIVCGLVAPLVLIRYFVYYTSRIGFLNHTKLLTFSLYLILIIQSIIASELIWNVEGDAIQVMNAAGERKFDIRKGLNHEYIDCYLKNNTGETLLLNGYTSIYVASKNNYLFNFKLDSLYFGVLDKEKIAKVTFKTDFNMPIKELSSEINWWSIQIVSSRGLFTYSVRNSSFIGVY